jgi:hypothetical protein
MAKDLMIELMLVDGCISLEMAETLTVAHYDDVEAYWLQACDLGLAGSFDSGHPATL